MSLFKKATKFELKARIAISGVSGSGKTYTALEIAKHISKGKSVAVIDTENGSASRYADLFQFDVCEITAPYTPEKFIEAINGAKDYDVIIIDSLSHAWFSILEKVQTLVSGGKHNNFTAWGPAGKLQEKLMQTMLQSPAHIIATMRSKTKYAQEETEEGGKKKQKIVKLGMESIQKEGLEYEFDICLDMDLSNTASVTKSRCPELSGQIFTKPSKDFSIILMNWLGSGEKVVALPQSQKELTFSDLWKSSREKLGDSPAREWIQKTSKELGVDDPKTLSSDQILSLINKLGES